MDIENSQKSILDKATVFTPKSKDKGSLSSVYLSLKTLAITLSRFTNKTVSLKGPNYFEEFIIILVPTDCSYLSSPYKK